MSGIVFIGHSVVKGTDYGGVTSTSTFAYQIGIANGYSAGDIFNKGKSSDLSAGMLSRFMDDVVAYDPDVVVIMPFINDWSTGALLSQSKDNLEMMVIIAQAKGIKVVLMTDNPPLSASASEFGTLHRYIEATKEIGHLYGCDVVELYYRVTHQKLIGNAGLNYVDNIHLSQSGHDFVAQLAAKPYYQGVFVK